MFKFHTFLIAAIFLFPMALPAQAAVKDPCSKELLANFFPPEFVQRSLETYQIPQDQWEGIIQDLQVKSQQLIKAVEAKAAKMNPNPTKDFSNETQRAVLSKLFKETLVESFTSVLNGHGVQDQKRILEMLEEIQTERSKSWEQCTKTAASS